MGKLLGSLFFFTGLFAVYYWGVRPLTAGTQAPTAPITLTGRGHPTPVALSEAQRGAADASRLFLDRWQARDYPAMYASLSPQAQGRIGKAAFVARYRNVIAEATVGSLQAGAGAVRLDMPQATVAYTVTMGTSAVGIIHQDNSMRLVYADGHWGVDWYPALIFKQLQDPYIVHLVTEHARRGSILDRRGIALAEDGQFWAVNVVPGQITGEPVLLQYLSSWLHMDTATIHHLYTLSWAQPDFAMPITTVTDAQYKTAPSGLQTMIDTDGVQLVPTDGRVYPQAAVASILVGYVDRTSHKGVAGLEAALDGVLRPTDGASLEVMNRPLTLSIATIATHPAVAGQDVRLTIDLATQRAAEKGLGIRPGAAVAIDPGTGAVLALASTPGYDPNRFEVADTVTRGVGPIRSTFPRATLGTYPIGSIFKIVSMAAGLERGGYTADTPIDGPGVWYGLGPSYPLHDWLASGHGTISLKDALVQSCDTCFYQVAKKLDAIDQDILPKFARAFGFGTATGIDQLTEAPGLVGDDAYKRRLGKGPWRTGDSVNLSIGQGYFLATPLQVADMLAGVAAHGLRPVPRLILQIGRRHMLVAKVAGTLPVTSAHLQSILEGMVGVTTEDTGTATPAFQGFAWQVAGKTGTAENPGGNPHAWFAAIAPAQRPRIALAVVLENGGEGSQVAAPVARQILQAYLPEALRAAATSGPQQLTAPGG